MRKLLNQQNPVFDNNVNVSRAHPLVDLFWLAGGAVLIVASFIIMLYVGMQWLAPHIPFSVEEKLASKAGLTKISSLEANANPKHKKRLAYLQNLTNDLAKAQELDGSISIQVHWVDDDMINAFATLGGHVFITKGLWGAMPNENALAMIIAHEIAHVKHRDPLKSLGAGVALSLVSAIIFGSGDTAASLVGGAGLITSLHFNRNMETDADETAIKALFKHYQHVAGATQFFADMSNPEHANLAFLQTHPLTQGRIDKLLAIQNKNGWSNQVSLVIDLPTLEALN